MISIIIQSLYFFLPVYGSKLIPPLFFFIPWGKKHVHSQINLCWKEIILAVLSSTFIFLIQKYIHNYGFQSWALIDYSDFSWTLGLLFGLGSIVGSGAKEYYKQKLNLHLSKPWVPGDQWGYLLGALLFSFLFYIPDISVVVTLLLISPLLQFCLEYLTRRWDL